MKNKLLKTILTSSILVGSMANITPVFANDFNADIEEVESQAKEHEEAADNLEALMKEITNEMTTTQSALNHLNNEIQTNEKFLDNAIQELEIAHQEMKILEDEIFVLEENIENRSEQLEDQARKVQVNGNSTSYIDFVLTSDSLTDIFARIDIVSKVVNTSNQMIEDQRKDKEAVVVKTEETERKILQQNALAEELEDTSTELESQKISQEVLVTQLEIEQTTVASDREILLEQRNNALKRGEELKSDREEARLAAVRAEDNKQNENLSRPASSGVESSAGSSTDDSSSNNKTSTPVEESEPEVIRPSPKPESKPKPEVKPESKPKPKPKPEVKPESKPKPEVKPDPIPVPSGNVLSIARQYIGTPYLYGGTTTSAFDCSGYTSHVFAKAGKNIPRNSAAQYSRSTKVSNPQPGDLVFFGSGSVTHVGIYQGAGRFIGSQTSTGVASASLTSGYWSSRVIGYGRY